MKKIFLAAVAILILLPSFACGGDIPYYHQESSSAPVIDPVSDPVPAFVVGENGFYDTENDIEYVRIEGIQPKKIGKLYASVSVGTGDGVSKKRFFEIENEHPTYFLCDESGNVFKNTMMPMLSMPGEESFDQQYPGLEPPSE